MDEHAMVRSSGHMVKKQRVEPMQVNTHEAKTHLSKLIRHALEGKEVVIAKGNRTLVRLEVLPGAREQPVSALSGG